MLTLKQMQRADRYRETYPRLTEADKLRLEAEMRAWAEESRERQRRIEDITAEDLRIIVR